jgi:hypothetical protein
MFTVFKIVSIHDRGFFPFSHCHFEVILVGWLLGRCRYIIMCSVSVEITVINIRIFVFRDVFVRSTLTDGVISRVWVYVCVFLVHYL